jgi:hypothetical protein
MACVLRTSLNRNTIDNSPPIDLYDRERRPSRYIRITPLVNGESLEELVTAHEGSRSFKTVGGYDGVVLEFERSVVDHFLTQIENLARHIGYLEAGRLRFAEERDSLFARFRLIEAAVDEPAARSLYHRESWLRMEVTDTTVRFVDSGYAEGKTETELRRDSPGVRDITASPMTLREIFVALARRHER